MTAPLALVQHSLPCGWLRLDERGCIEAVNPALCRLVGATEQALRGQPFDSLLSRPSRMLYQSYLQPLLRLHGHVEEFALSFARADGQEPEEALVYSAAVEHDGRRGVELVVASVRRRRGIEEELLRIKRAADQAPGMIFQLLQRPDGRCQAPYASESVRRLYGVTEGQLAASIDPVLAQLSAATQAALRDGMRQAAEAGQAWHAVFEVQPAGAAAQWHEVHARPRRLPDGSTLWHGHCANVTERRQLEQDKAQRLADRQAQEARSTFLARVSHELRTPLNGILGFAQLLAHDEAHTLSPLQRERLGLLTEAGSHLLALVNDVLEISALEADRSRLPRQPCALGPLVAAALQAVRQQADDAGIRLLPPELPPALAVQAHPQRLAQVLGNLLSNAVKYNRPAGTVQVRAQASAQGPWVDVAVVDTGKGLTEQQQASLFQPFNRLGAERSAIRGHGLGLAISKQLLDLMGGEMQVVSQPGRGSTFTLRLPVAEAPAPGPGPAPLFAGAPGDGQGPAQPAVPAPVLRHVLYVEDDAVNTLLMESIARLRPGLQLHCAATGVEALERCAQQVFELLLIDMNLPDTDGIGLLAALRQQPGSATAPALMVSAGAQQSDVQRALDHGFQGYWMKPLDLASTLASLDDWLQPRP